MTKYKQVLGAKYISHEKQMKLFHSIDKGKHIWKHYTLYLDPVNYTPHLNNGCLKDLEELEEQLLLINAYN